MKTLRFLALVVIISSLIGSVSAAIPQFIKYQGLLTDTSGATLNGSQNMTFKLYDAASGGNLLWTESQSVNVTDGLFQVSLGASTPLITDIFEAAQELWLGVSVGANPEMSPRERIGAVPYAHLAEVAQNAISTPGSPWIQAGNLSDLVAGAGTLTAYPTSEYEYGLQWGSGIFPAACFISWTGGYIFQTTETMLVEVDANTQFSYGGVYYIYGTASPDDDVATTSNWAYGLWTLEYTSLEINKAAKPFRAFGTGGTFVWARKR
ncbi:MAG TPA: hypothetical protein VHP63_01830 [candidate division Zixibacteria bacterium]|nr:hypothetical protein [candidate division Zixibacteria bacterium]